MIEGIRARAARLPRGSGEVRLGIGDDCAILRPRRGEEIVVTTDMCLETRHFRRDWHSPQSIGHRTLARGLSDLAAMGARPVAAFLSLAIPRKMDAKTAWLDGFFDEFCAFAEQVKVPLAGGDTAEAPGEEVLADIVLLGGVPAGRALRRDRAREGDRLFVTGRLGGAAFQLRELLRRKPSRQPGDQRGPHFFPEPRLGVGLALVRRRLSSAAIDLSDGLSTDLHHLCRASGVSAEIEVERLPLSPLLADVSKAEAIEMALNGGEDYELLFTAGAKTRMPAKLDGIAVTEIGRIRSPERGRPRVALVDAAGRRRPLRPGGWEHLR